MISYWKNTNVVHVDEGLTLITGFYDHKNQNGGGHKALGIHWHNYPQPRGVLSPCVIPENTRSAILAGLLHHAVMNGNKKQVTDITKAIDFFVN